MPRARRARALCVLLFLVTWAGFAGAQDSAPAGDLLLILDASGSMWGQIEGENKIVIARRVLKGLIEGLPDEGAVGLVAYGHRREGDCADVETVVPMGPLDRAALIGKVESINPKGKTPITLSVNQAFDVARAHGEQTTIILVSDGLETCAGDPCDAVRRAREEGIEFRMHVVGFGMAGDDVSQLECVAQAGDGLYLDAESAEELAAALDQVVTAPPAVSPGRLSIKAIADGELTDVAVHVTYADSGEEAAGGRTYTSPDTNPRILALPYGTYNVRVIAVGMKGDIRRTFEGVEVVDGEVTEKVVDFSSGELAIKVTRNGELSDATVNIYPTGTRDRMAGGRTYTTPAQNPSVYRITTGTYDVKVASVEISNRPEHLFTGIVVEPGGRADREHEFASGTMKIGAVNGSELVDATVNVVDAETGKAVAGGRTYTSAQSNPKAYELTPGRYRVRVQPVRLKDKPRREIEVTVEAGSTVERSVDFAGEG